MTAFEQALSLVIAFAVYSASVVLLADGLRGIDAPEDSGDSLS